MPRGPGVEYFDAPEVEIVAGRVIDAHHRRLDGTYIRYVFREPAAQAKGRVVLGKARIISGLNAFLAGEPGAFFCMEIARDMWKNLTDPQREALVDHELEHFQFDPERDGAAYILGHDVEEFRVIMERHGPWTPIERSFVQAALPFLEATEDE